MELAFRGMTKDWAFVITEPEAGAEPVEADVPGGGGGMEA